MGWSEMEGRCKRHPKHKQSKGVCPSCLRERLSHLPTTSSTTTNTSSNSSPYSSDTISSSSSVASPIHQDQKTWMPLVIKGDGESGLIGKPGPLAKSRSLAFTNANPAGEGMKDEIMEKTRRKKKKGGFWSQLLGCSGSGGNKRKKDVLLLQSKTMKETSYTKWFFLS